MGKKSKKENVYKDVNTSKHESIDNKDVVSINVQKAIKNAINQGEGGIMACPLSGGELGKILGGWEEEYWASQKEATDMIDKAKNMTDKDIEEFVNSVMKIKDIFSTKSITKNDKKRINNKVSLLKEILKDKLLMIPDKYQENTKGCLDVFEIINSQKLCIDKIHIDSVYKLFKSVNESLRCIKFKEVPIDVMLWSVTASLSKARSWPDRKFGLSMAKEYAGVLKALLDVHPKSVAKLPVEQRKEIEQMGEAASLAEARQNSVDYVFAYFEAVNKAFNTMNTEKMVQQVAHGLSATESLPGEEVGQSNGWMWGGVKFNKVKAWFNAHPESLEKLSDELRKEIRQRSEIASLAQNSIINYPFKDVEPDIPEDHQNIVNYATSVFADFEAVNKAFNTMNTEEMVQRVAYGLSAVGREVDLNKARNIDDAFDLVKAWFNAHPESLEELSDESRKEIQQSSETASLAQHRIINYLYADMEPDTPEARQHVVDHAASVFAYLKAVNRSFNTMSNEEIIKEIALGYNDVTNVLASNFGLTEYRQAKRRITRIEAGLAVHLDRFSRVPTDLREAVRNALVELKRAQQSIDYYNDNDREPSNERKIAIFNNYSNYLHKCFILLYKASKYMDLEETLEEIETGKQDLSFENMQNLGTKAFGFIDQFEVHDFDLTICEVAKKAYTLIEAQHDIYFSDLLPDLQKGIQEANNDINNANQNNNEQYDFVNYRSGMYKYFEVINKAFIYIAFKKCLEKVREEAKDMSFEEMSKKVEEVAKTYESKAFDLVAYKMVEETRALVGAWFDQKMPIVIGLHSLQKELRKAEDEINLKNQNIHIYNINHKQNNLENYKESIFVYFFALKNVLEYLDKNWKKGNNDLGDEASLVLNLLEDEDEDASFSLNLL